MAARADWAAMVAARDDDDRLGEPRDQPPDEPLAGFATTADGELSAQLLTGIAAFRWLAWAWMVVILVLGRPELDQDKARPWVAYTLALLALATSATITMLLRRDPAWLSRPEVIAGEVAVGFVLGVGDSLAYNGVDHPQWLASTWPLAGILTAGAVVGIQGGLGAGVVVGWGRMCGAFIDPTFRFGRSADVISAVSTVVLYAMAGGIAGYAAGKLREAERRISLAQAREEIARTLHDGVLQTLAIVQRRTRDPDLARLAHQQERELRDYLFGLPGSLGGAGELGARLRAAAARFETHFGGRATVALAPDVPVLAPEMADALVGAVSEALTNAGKHGRARTVTIFAEPAEGPGGSELFCSIKDDGDGFDPATLQEGIGLSRSIRGRICDVGGRVELDGHPTRGAEVRCWVPTSGH
jgi:signal transduction histidine kinase